ncbi:hypothetical protein [Neobacillus drentensis]|uniref:hypothetical protein n=1 Tax=Neobacillus drentensis TaxID=220684 RepID=UPI002FFE8A40
MNRKKSRYLSYRGSPDTCFVLEWTIPPFTYRNANRPHDVIKSLPGLFRINTVDAWVLSWTRTTI